MIHQKIFYVDTKEVPLEPTDKLLILDRDGVINYDNDGYFHDKDNVTYIKKNLEVIKSYSDLGWSLCVASNQSGIGRGFYSREAFIELCQIMFKDLLREGISISRWYYCPHNPNKSNCYCRKPNPGMLLKAKKDFQAKRVIFMGDSHSDQLAAMNAKVRFIPV